MPNPYNPPLLTSSLTDADLLALLSLFFSSTDLQRGMDYYRQGAVKILQMLENGRHLTLATTCRGSARQPYQQRLRIILDSTDQIEHIYGHCSCPVSSGCKHMAAACLQWLSGQIALSQTGFSPALNKWLLDLERCASDTQASAATDNSFLIYLIDPKTHRFYWRQTRPLKNGKLAKPRKAEFYDYQYNGLPAPFQAEDVSIIKLAEVALRSSYYEEKGSVTLRGKMGARVLQQAINTGRVFLHHDATLSEADRLQLGPARQVNWDWQAVETQYRLQTQVDTPAIVIATEPLWYLDLDNRQMGELHSGLPHAMEQQLLLAPVVSKDNAERLGEALTTLGMQHRVHIPLPVEIPRQQHAAVVPQPILRLSLGQPGAVPLALLRFEYGHGSPAVTSAQPASAVLIWRDAKALHEMPRDLALEAQHIEHVKALGFWQDTQSRQWSKADIGTAYRLADSSAEDWLAFQQHGIAALEQQGFVIERTPEFARQVIDSDDWYIDLEDSGSDWFDLELGIVVNDQRISLLEPLLQLLREKTNIFSDLDALPAEQIVALTLGNGDLLPIPAGRLKSLLAPILELADLPPGQHKARLSTLDAARLAELEHLTDTRWFGGERLRALAYKLSHFDGIQESPPSAQLQATLRHYQQQGLNWLQFLREYGFSGILADDMGLGKTVQTLAHLQLEKEQGRADLPSLVVAPTSLVSNWRAEAARFTPNLKVLTLHGQDRAQYFSQMTEADLIITTYPLLLRDDEVLRKQPFHLLILDEAQHIKNPRAKVHQLATLLQARHRLCLTGTPMENHLGELWALCHFLMPGLLGSSERFVRMFRNPIEKLGEESRRQILAQRLRPFMLRRSKQEVAQDLPEKTEIIRWVELSGKQRDLYESLRFAFDKRLRDIIATKGVGQSQIMILDALLKLRQTCCDPRLLKIDTAHKVKESAKLDLLREMLPEMVEEGRRILLFSQFTSMLALIEGLLFSLKIPYIKLTGQSRDRGSLIEQFQSGTVPVFLISLKAGGTGLNLTAADTIIHYDPWWNPAVEQQATDRAHRIGQDKPVFVYKLLTVGTVEEKILAMQDRKRGLADGLMSGRKGGQHLINAADLEQLLQPLQ